MTRDQLLKTPGLQAVLVETRVRDLLDNAEACVAAGKHVHIDKPAGESLPQFKRILDAAAKQKLLVQMGYMYRYNPAVVLLREFLAKGWLGEVFEVHAVMSKVVAAPERKRLAEFRGGMMFELGCHVLDLVIGVLGKPKAVASFNRHTSSLDDGLLDNMLAVLNYPRASATVKSSALEVEGFDRRHLVVCGTEGTFHIQPLDNPAARVSLSRAIGRVQEGNAGGEVPEVHPLRRRRRRHGPHHPRREGQRLPLRARPDGSGDAARSVRPAAQRLTHLLPQRTGSPPPSRVRIPLR